jgi:hypothetical protein
MAINRWWDGKPDERYWMEITDRPNLGANLLAPTSAKGGKETFSYTLVDHVQEGDVVFHWWSANKPPAIVAKSTVSGHPFRSRIRWAARSLNSGGERTTAAFEAPLDRFTELDKPVTLGDLRVVESQLRSIRDDLSAAVGNPIYFPWAFSDKRPLRTTQGYLVKLPAAVVAMLGLQGSGAPLDGSSGPVRGVPSQGASGGLQRDTELRLATEQHAVKIATEHFEALGFTVEDVGARRSYDLHALGPDGDEVHVEVKGSTAHSVAIELTEGEVRHWGDSYERALVVVDQIDVARKGGRYSLSGGRKRVWRNWQIDHLDGRLTPTRYRYLLAEPSSGSA